MHYASKYTVNYMVLVVKLKECSFKIPGEKENIKE